jgi:hypothetical protein
VTARRSPVGFWFARRPVGGASSMLVEYAGVGGGEHPDGAVVDIDEDIDDAKPMVLAHNAATGAIDGQIGTTFADVRGR